MDKMLVAILEKMHQALAHLHDVLPAAAGMKGVLASIRADLDAMAPPAEKAPEPEADPAPEPEGAAEPVKAAADEAKPHKDDKASSGFKKK